MTVKNILLGFLALVLLAGGYLVGRELEQRHCQGEALAQAQLHSLEIVRVNDEATNWATAISKGQGEALIRAFVSGISPAIQAERRESLEISAISLLRVAGVAGVHIFSPEGKVVYSSNGKLAATGILGDSETWALAATELVTRQSNLAGLRDFVIPLISTGKVIAVVWLEYAEEAVREAGRPPGLTKPNFAAATAQTNEPARADGSQHP